MSFYSSLLKKAAMSLEDTRQMLLQMGFKEGTTDPMEVPPNEEAFNYTDFRKGAYICVNVFLPREAEIETVTLSNESEAEIATEYGDGTQFKPGDMAYHDSANGLYYFHGGEKGQFLSTPESILQGGQQGVAIVLDHAKDNPDTGENHVEEVPFDQLKAKIREIFAEAWQPAVTASQNDPPAFATAGPHVYLAKGPTGPHYRPKEGYKDVKSLCRTCGMPFSDHKTRV